MVMVQNGLGSFPGSFSHFSKLPIFLTIERLWLECLLTPNLLFQLNCCRGENAGREVGSVSLSTGTKKACYVWDTM